MTHPAFHEMDSEAVPKRPRLIADPKPALHQPLHIDTRDVHEISKKVLLLCQQTSPSHHVSLSMQPAYTPQVENISPTPLDDMRQDLSPFNSRKEELVQNINRIEREISEAETQIAKLRQKQVRI